MSEAEDAVNGDVCEVCGEWFDDVIEGRESPGHPRVCEACSTDDDDDDVFDDDSDLEDSNLDDDQDDYEPDYDSDLDED